MLRIWISVLTLRPRRESAQRKRYLLVQYQPRRSRKRTPHTVGIRACRVLTPDAAYCIYRVPPPVVLPNTSHLAAKHPPHVPAYLRSSKLPVPRSTVILRINELMAELGVETQRLVMPTRNNLEALDGVLVAGAALCDMKRQVDRVEQDLRSLRAQREGYVAPLQSRGVCTVHTRSLI